ncbi:metalloprotease [Brevundimonas lenta]|uniref:Zn-dependent protease n=1 Tax=Brevundimonas lenta TaxID=424796 RepID=A0A7W6NRB7_9CAUL|nr:site-2 protease family protein [Brevundimonas lenta]MBB4084005.1 Zn-dependent protease [Brevundimonas lenta]
MSETDTPRRPGPWDIQPAEPAAPAPAEPARVAEPPLDKGQSPLWAIISTLLLGGMLYWFTGSLVMVIAVLFGLFVHEYGHVLAMNRLGMGPARIYIIPFLGGLAKGQRMPASEWHGVLVSLAGPAFGLLAAIPFLALFLWDGDRGWLQGVLAVGLLNLVNLAPAPPLDGSKALGPVLARIHPMVEKAALLLIGALVVVWGFSNGSLLFAGFLTIALIGHLRRGAWRPEGRQLTWGEAGKSTGLFVLTAIACAGVLLLGIMPGAGSLENALAGGLRFFEFGR